MRDRALPRGTCSNLPREFPSEARVPSCELRWGSSRNQLQRLGAGPAPAEQFHWLGEGPWKLQGLPPCSLPPTRPPQQVISVKTGRLAVLLIIHEAALPRSGRQRRRGSSSPREGESQAAWLSGGAGVGWGPSLPSPICSVHGGHSRLVLPLLC